MKDPIHFTEELKDSQISFLVTYCKYMSLVWATFIYFNGNCYTFTVRLSLATLLKIQKGNKVPQLSKEPMPKSHLLITHKERCILLFPYFFSLFIPLNERNTQKGKNFYFQ